ncbi:response regulator transcription factor [Rathayibacter sp. VKM Ac-2835]|uniref:LytR/AlgR family response regulator transcription factor n=1 Tax=Rathayibacter sp. VKM Ac-2835 TaxID=2739043 RepID=UPI001566E448|nr:LytTR family DNA-binding domain-containing protein [Rathayibacter sp. VKM Ac-2835]NRG41089.1 response regulator transcription factor [Rathayibacter sp. VKM Ac-2835]
MISIAVVEDEDRSRELLVSHLERYQAESGLRFDVSTFSDGREILSRYKPVYDVVFLDVEMEHVDGMTTAKRIREVDKEVVLVFITNSPQYAIGGYQVAALSYLLKPVPYGGFAEELGRCIEQAARRERSYLLLGTGVEQHRVDVEEVLFIESVKHRITVHTIARTYSLVGSLKSFEERLAADDFFRSNNCYLVNLRHVTGVKQNICSLRGGHELQISRPRKKGLLEAISDYLGSSRA